RFGQAGGNQLAQSDGTGVALAFKDGGLGVLTAVMGTRVLYDIPFVNHLTRCGQLGWLGKEAARAVLGHPHITVDAVDVLWWGIFFEVVNGRVVVVQLRMELLQTGLDRQGLDLYVKGSSGSVFIFGIAQNKF